MYTLVRAIEGTWVQVLWTFQLSSELWPSMTTRAQSPLRASHQLWSAAVSAIHCVCGETCKSLYPFYAAFAATQSRQWHINSLAFCCLTYIGNMHECYLKTALQIMTSPSYLESNAPLSSLSMDSVCPKTPECKLGLLLASIFSEKLCNWVETSDCIGHFTFVLFHGPQPCVFAGGMTQRTWQSVPTIS